MNEQIQTRAATVRSDPTRHYGTILFTLAVLSFAGVCAYAWTHAGESISLAHTAAAAAPKVDTSAFDALEIEANSAYVYDMSTGDVLYEKNADAQLPLASITKVALMLAIEDVLDPNGTTTITPGAVLRGEGGIATGEVWRTADLIDYTLLASSNVGAEALAESADAILEAQYPGRAPGKAAVSRMNAMAREWGMTHTYYLNASGLDASPSQPGSVSSARDIGTLFTHATSIPLLFASTIESEGLFQPLSGTPVLAKNTNDALSEIPGIVLGKTGFTDLAGGNLAVVFDSTPQHRLAAVVLGSSVEGRFSDMLKIVSAAQRTFPTEHAFEPSRDEVQ